MLKALLIDFFNGRDKLNKEKTFILRSLMGKRIQQFKSSQF
jgi:hypothetical protein